MQTVFTLLPGKQTKVCCGCREEKQFSEFYRNRLGKYGLDSKCKPCKIVVGKQFRKNNPILAKNYTRRGMLKKFYGITPEQYQNMLEAQNGVCAICASSNTKSARVENFAVDHDHKTGYIRGLLCLNCNKGLGHFSDSPEIMSIAVAYLLKSTAFQKVPTKKVG